MKNEAVIRTIRNLFDLSRSDNKLVPVVIIGNFNDIEILLWGILGHFFGIVVTNHKYQGQRNAYALSLYGSESSIGILRFSCDYVNRILKKKTEGFRKQQKGKVGRPVKRSKMLKMLKSFRIGFLMGLKENLKDIKKDIEAKTGLVLSICELEKRLIDESGFTRREHDFSDLDDMSCYRGYAKGNKVSIRQGISG